MMATGNDANHRRHQESQPLVVRTTVLSNGGDHLRRTAPDSPPACSSASRDVATANCKAGILTSQHPVGAGAKRPTSVFVDASSSMTVERSAARRRLIELDRQQQHGDGGNANYVSSFAADSPLSFNTVISAVATIEKRPISPPPPLQTGGDSSAAAYSRDTSTPSPRPDVVQDEKFRYPDTASAHPLPAAPSAAFSVDVNCRAMMTSAEQVPSSAGRRVVYPGGWSASVTPVVVAGMGSRPPPNPPPRSNHVDQQSATSSGSSSRSGTLPTRGVAAGDWRMVRRTTGAPWTTSANVEPPPSMTGQPAGSTGSLMRNTDINSVAVRSMTAAEAVELCDVRPHSGTHSIVF